mmetsp:Transcript_19009/g.47577  ORF Transcript_19009/g.47577 Transcript_19009/m.47577 type:complete len:327 (-) Transcript_19009:195-1175(-)
MLEARPRRLQRSFRPCRCPTLAGAKMIRQNRETHFRLCQSSPLRFSAAAKSRHWHSWVVQRQHPLRRPRRRRRWPQLPALRIRPRRGSSSCAGCAAWRRIRAFSGCCRWTTFWTAGGRSVRFRLERMLGKTSTRVPTPFRCTPTCAQTSRIPTTARRQHVGGRRPAGGRGETTTTARRRRTISGSSAVVGTRGRTRSGRRGTIGKSATSGRTTSPTGATGRHGITRGVWGGTGRILILQRRRRRARGTRANSRVKVSTTGPARGEASGASRIEVGAVPRTGGTGTQTIPTETTRPRAARTGVVIAAPTSTGSRKPDDHTPWHGFFT